MLGLFIFSLALHLLPKYQIPKSYCVGLILVSRSSNQPVLENLFSSTKLEVFIQFPWSKVSHSRLCVPLISWLGLATVGRAGWKSWCSPQTPPLTAAVRTLSSLEGELHFPWWKL